MKMYTRPDHLNKRQREFLATPRATEIANGANCASNEWRILSRFQVSWEAHNVTHPLLAASRAKLARLIADPTQPVCDCEGDCQQLMPHVCSSAIEQPVSLTASHWYDLTCDDKQRWCGQHAHGRIVIFSDSQGEFAVWFDGDPTKSPAWDTWEPVPLELAARLVPAPAMP
jgi:hypothetical protein